jgi:hypothetical protein
MCTLSTIVEQLVNFAETRPLFMRIYGELIDNLSVFDA